MTVETHPSELHQLRAKVKTLEGENDRLRARIEKLEDWQRRAVDKLYGIEAAKQLIAEYEADRD